MPETVADFIFETHDVHGIPVVSCHQAGAEFVESSFEEFIGEWKKLL